MVLANRSLAAPLVISGHGNTPFLSQDWLSRPPTFQLPIGCCILLIICLDCVIKCRSDDFVAYGACCGKSLLTQASRGNLMPC